MSPGYRCEGQSSWGVGEGPHLASQKGCRTDACSAAGAAMLSGPISRGCTYQSPKWMGWEARPGPEVGFVGEPTVRPASREEGSGMSGS